MIAVLPLLSVALAQDPHQLAADAAPLPAYLSAAQIRDALVAVDWQDCAKQQQVQAATAQLSFSVAGDGTLTEVAWSGIAAPLAACWTAALGGVSLPPHDEVPVAVGWTIAAREGTVFPYPVVRLAERAVAPLFLFVAPDATPAQRQALREALGFSADGAAERRP